MCWSDNTAKKVCTESTGRWYSTTTEGCESPATRNFLLAFSLSDIGIFVVRQMELRGKSPRSCVYISIHHHNLISGGISDRLLAFSGSVLLRPAVTMRSTRRSSGLRYPAAASRNAGLTPPGQHATPPTPAGSPVSRRLSWVRTPGPPAGL